LNELAERKKLYNQLQEIKGNVRVFCRVRPYVKNEKENTIKFPSDSEISIRDPTTETIKTFEYDHLFPIGTTQEDVFKEVKPTIVSILDGFNVCIFAYGQTGSGKTYTMEGPAHERGVYYRAIEELFKVIDDRSHNYNYSLEISLLEIYNEQIKDFFGEINVLISHSLFIL
jgi:kinesin family protein C2/C3